MQNTCMQLNKGLTKLVGLLALTLTINACAPQDYHSADAKRATGVTETRTIQFNDTAPAAPANTDVYRLGSGDRLKITVFGEPDLSGEFDVDGSGAISLPLVGEVNVGNRSVRQAEQTIQNAYKGEYLLNPRVSAEVMNFRPFFILGEVNTPGNYPFISGMTVLNAVAVAGGYTYRAKKDNIRVRRTINGQEQEFSLSEVDRVLPGDVIHVYERFF